MTKKPLQQAAGEVIIDLFNSISSEHGGKGAAEMISGAMTGLAVCYQQLAVTPTEAEFIEVAKAGYAAALGIEVHVVDIEGLNQHGKLN